MPDKTTMPGSSIILLVTYFLFIISYFLETMRSHSGLLFFLITAAPIIINIIAILLKKTWARIMGIVILAVLVLIILAGSILFGIQNGFMVTNYFLFGVALLLSILLYFFGFTKKSKAYYQ